MIWQTVSRKIPSLFKFKYVALCLLLVLLAYHASDAQVLPVLRIGVLDEPNGPLSRGSQLAVGQINAAGGMISATGTRYEIQLLLQSPDDLPTAIMNFQAAAVIAIFAPEDPELLFSYQNLLSQLQIPIFTPSTDDTLIALDTSDYFIRIRARDELQAEGLADYLINDLNLASIVTLQLDLESLLPAASFTRTARRLGLAPEKHIIAELLTNRELVPMILDLMPQAIVVYGRPARTARLYTMLREADWTGYFVYEQAGSLNFRNRVQESLLQGVLSFDTWSHTLEDAASESFLFAFMNSYGEVPGAVDAAAYDAMLLLREAFARPGSLVENILTTRNLEAVQGSLNTPELPRGEISGNTLVSELGVFGAPLAVARYLDGERIPLEESPLPTATLTPASDIVYLTITAPFQNVRTGPGLNYPILGQLSEGSQAQVIGANRELTWVVIEYRGTLGWLSRSILEITGSNRNIPIIAAPPSPTPFPTPTLTPAPTSTPFPISIFVIAPQAGNQVSGTVLVTGSAIHPNFQSFTLELGPDPNPANIWIPLNDQFFPVYNGTLASWNTTLMPDGIYQLRLQLRLRDGTSITTISNGIRVLNATPTAVPQAVTPVPAPPIAAFSTNAVLGAAPFTVTFTNRSFGRVDGLSWDFGDGTFSTETNPVHTYNVAGQYTVILTASGAGGQDTAISFITVLQPTATPTATITFTPTWTATITSTWTAIPTNTATASHTPTLTILNIDPSPTLTLTATATSTATETSVPPTATETATLPPTVLAATATETPTLTATATSTATETSVPSTATETPTLTATATSTATETSVPPTATLTATATSTATETAVPPTATLTETPTLAPTATETIVPPTPTETPTLAPTATETATETIVPPTPTETPTLTATATSTVTETATETIVPPTPTEIVAETELPETENPLASIPVLPNLSDLQQRLRSIYELGVSQGRRSTVFALAGDSSLAQQGFLDPFASGGVYSLDETSQVLQSLIDWYNITPVNGGSSFSHDSLAVDVTWTAQDLVNPDNRASDCLEGESPLACELRLSHAAVVIISVGRNDAMQMTDPNLFRDALQTAVNIALEQAVIPVLVTIQPVNDPAISEQLNLLNAIIAELANENQIPMINSWQHFTTLPDNGLSSDSFSPSVAPSGSGDLTTTAINTYGLNAFNFDVLTTLNELHNIVFPDALPPQ